MAANAMTKKKNKGGAPANSENQGIATIDMLTFTHTSNNAEVFHPDRLTIGSKRKAGALQSIIDVDYASGFFVAEYPPGNCPEKGSPLFKVNSKPFVQIKYRSQVEFDNFLHKATGHYNDSNTNKEPISVKTFKKDLIDGLGFSINCVAGTLTFDLNSWNKSCFRLQEGGRSKKVGNKPNLNKIPIAEIPKYYRNFGTVTTGAAVITTGAAPTMVNSPLIPTPSAAPSGPRMVVVGGLPVPFAGSTKQPNTPPTACKKRSRSCSEGQDAVKKANSNKTSTTTATGPLTSAGTGSRNVFLFPTFDIPAMNKREFASYDMDTAEQFDVNAMHVDVEDVCASCCVVSMSDVSMAVTSLSKDELAIYRMKSLCD